MKTKHAAMFSKACEYAIRASIFISGKSLQQIKVGQKEIAKAIDSPEAFTAKTLQILTRNNIISSDKGPHGGFYFSKDQLKNIYLQHIVKAIDGTIVYKGCGLGLKTCNESKPCPVHFQFKAIRDELKQMLETTSIQDLAIGTKSGETFLKR